MTAFTAIDLSKLPPLSIVDDVDYDVVLEDMVSRYSAMVPDIAVNIQLESDPVRKLLEIAAYEKTLLHARVNQAARAVTLAFAAGPDLDNLGALIPLDRRDGEEDYEYRRRIQLAPEGFSTAGPAPGYIYHARRADAAVRDVYVETYDPARTGAQDPNPGDVHVYVLGSETGELPDIVAEKVMTALGDDVRPLTDNVTIKAPGIITYEISAVLTLSAGPSAQLVREAAIEAVQKYISDNTVLGGVVALSGITAALHVGGVIKVHISQPAADIEASPRHVPVCTQINVDVGEGP